MEKLSTSKDAAGLKLLILYILRKLDRPIGSMELTDYIVEERLMDYATYQQRVNELVLSGHIASIVDEGKTQYKISDAGLGLLSEMLDLIPQTEKNRVERTLRKLDRRIINNRSVKADYTPVDEHGGVVHLRIKEGDLTIMGMEIAIASKKEARAICRNFKSNTSKIYAGIVDLLLDLPSGDNEIR